MRIPKTCDFCQKEFIARKTTSKTCSDDCAKRLYNLNQRNRKIHQAIEESRNKRGSDAFKPIDDIQAVQLREVLDLKQAAAYLHISPLTLRRWVLSGKVTSQKIGKKHMFLKSKLTEG
jgi:DNA-binding transcriptional regulator YiaG